MFCFPSNFHISSRNEAKNTHSPLRQIVLLSNGYCEIYMSTKLKTWKFGFKVTATVHYFPVCEIKKKKIK